jgi:hypothetical protein
MALKRMEEMSVMSVARGDYCKLSTERATEERMAREQVAREQVEM